MHCVISNYDKAREKAKFLFYFLLFQFKCFQNVFSENNLIMTIIYFLIMSNGIVNKIYMNYTCFDGYRIHFKR